MNIQRWRTSGAAYCVFGVTIFVSGPALACNPIEFLFGNCRPPQPPAIQERAAPEVNRVVRKAPPKRPVVHDSAAYKQPALSAPAGVAVGSVTHFADDSTLRNGDVVVTPTGFLIYRGRRKDGVAETSFTPLGSGKVELVNLERASRRSTSGDWSARSPLATTNRTTVVRNVQPAGANAMSASTPN